jgi:hypothetical protein
MAALCGRKRTKRLSAFAAALLAMGALVGCAGRFPEPGLLSLPEPRCNLARPSDESWRPGCATRRNLAATAANPEDLYLARREGARDAMRRDAVIAGYMQSRASTPAPPPVAIAPANGSGGTQ